MKLVGLDGDPLFHLLLADQESCVRLTPPDSVFALHVVPSFPWIREAEPAPGWARWVREVLIAPARSDRRGVYFV